MFYLPFLHPEPRTSTGLNFRFSFPFSRFFCSGLSKVTPPPPHTTRMTGRGAEKARRRTTRAATWDNSPGSAATPALACRQPADLISLPVLGEHVAAFSKCAGVSLRAKWTPPPGGSNPPGARSLFPLSQPPPPRGLKRRPAWVAKPSPGTSPN